MTRRRDPSIVELLAKILRANKALEDLHVPHQEVCPASNDKEATCSCSADQINAKIQKAIQELNLKNVRY